MSMLSVITTGGLERIQGACGRTNQARDLAARVCGFVTTAGSLRPHCNEGQTCYC